MVVRLLAVLCHYTLFAVQLMEVVPVLPHLFVEILRFFDVESGQSAIHAAVKMPCPVTALVFMPDR